MRNFDEKEMNNLKAAPSWSLPAELALIRVKSAHAVQQLILRIHLGGQRRSRVQPQSTMRIVRGAKNRSVESRLAESRVVESRVAESRVAESRVAESRVAKSRVAKNRLVANRAAENKLARNQHI